MLVAKILATKFGFVPDWLVALEKQQEFPLVSHMFPLFIVAYSESTGPLLLTRFNFNLNMDK